MPCWSAHASAFVLTGVLYIRSRQLAQLIDPMVSIKFATLLFYEPGAVTDTDCAEIGTMTDFSKPGAFRSRWVWQSSPRRAHLLDASHRTTGADPEIALVIYQANDDNLRSEIV